VARVIRAVINGPVIACGGDGCPQSFGVVHRDPDGRGLIRFDGPGLRPSRWRLDGSRFGLDLYVKVPRRLWHSRKRSDGQVERTRVLGQRADLPVAVICPHCAVAQVIDLTPPTSSS